MLLEDEELEQEIVSLIKSDKKTADAAVYSVVRIKPKRSKHLMMNI